MASPPVSDSAFPDAGKPSPQSVDELLKYARAQLGLGPERPWRLISSHLKLRKVFFEVEELGREGPRRIIGKVASSKKSRGAYDILRRLWSAGLCPPSPHCVCEPLAYFPEQNLLLQERAPGTQLLELVSNQSSSRGDIDRAAEWLITLQRLCLPDTTKGQTLELDRPLSELQAAIPAQAGRIAVIAEYITENLETPGLQVPSHGDYHLMNIYLNEKRVTAIDLDTFALREPMIDAAYFIAQSAIMGFHTFQSFEPTEHVRAQFASAYQQYAPEQFDMERIRVHVALAFLRSLHYDFCILKTNPVDTVNPFLSAAERCMGGESIRLAA
jgi:hypothetical protein